MTFWSKRERKYIKHYRNRPQRGALEKLRKKYKTKGILIEWFISLQPNGTHISNKKNLGLM